MESLKIMCFTALLGLLTVSCSQIATETETITWKVKKTKTWFKGQGFENVESVLFDQEQQVLYITNGLDYVPGTDGFISKASADGKNLELKWVENLNRPTGMALKDGTLYVADLFHLLAIDTQSGEIRKRYEEPISGSALNDVAIDGNGDIYVSASRIGAIFKLIDGQLELWAQDKLLLKYANGLLAQKEQLLVAGFNLSNVHLKSGQLAEMVTNPSIKDLEGLVSDGENGFFMTTVGQSSMYHLGPNFEATLLLSERDYFGDLTFDKEQNIIYVPRGNEDTDEYYLTVIEMDN